MVLVDTFRLFLHIVDAKFCQNAVVCATYPRLSVFFSLIFLRKAGKGPA